MTKLVNYPHRFFPHYASTIYQIFIDYSMVQITVFIVIGAIIISMGVAMYAYTQNQINFITAKTEEPVIVGPVEYTISFDGTSKGSKEDVPQNTFVKIKITAKNISDKITKISGGQFYLVDDKQKKYLPVDGGFSADGLLEPNKPVIVTIQFDIPYDDLKKYNVLIRPSKQQSSVDTALICIINC